MKPLSIGQITSSLAFKMRNLQLGFVVDLLWRDEEIAAAPTRLEALRSEGLEVMEGRKARQAGCALWLAEAKAPAAVTAEAAVDVAAEDTVAAEASIDAARKASSMKARKSGAAAEVLQAAAAIGSTLR